MIQNASSVESDDSNLVFSKKQCLSAVFHAHRIEYNSAWLDDSDDIEFKAFEILAQSCLEKKWGVLKPLRNYIGRIKSLEGKSLIQHFSHIPDGLGIVRQLKEIGVKEDEGEQKDERSLSNLSNDPDRMTFLKAASFNDDDRAQRLVETNFTRGATSFSSATTSQEDDKHDQQTKSKKSKTFSIDPIQSEVLSSTNEDRNWLHHIASSYGIPYEGNDTELKCFNALKESCIKGDWEKIKALKQEIEKIRDPEGNPLLIHFLRINRYPETIVYLIQNVITAHRTDTQGNTPLHIVCMLGLVKYCLSLLDINDGGGKNHKGVTPFYCAIETNNLDMVIPLWKFHEPYPSENHEVRGKTVRVSFSPLLYAVKSKALSCLNFFKRKFAQQEQNQLGSALHIAVFFDNEETQLVKTLFEHFPQEMASLIERPNNSKQTPFSLAAELGKLHSLEVLAKCGADLEALDDEGYAPIHWAIRKRHLEVVKRLNQWGVNLLQHFDRKPSIELLGDDHSAEAESIRSYLLNWVSGVTRSSSTEPLPLSLAHLNEECSDYRLKHSLSRVKKQNVLAQVTQAIPLLSEVELTSLIRKNGQLDKFLTCLPHLPLEEALLAKKIGDRLAFFEKVDAAFYYFGTAIAIAEKIENEDLQVQTHQAASHLFLKKCRKPVELWIADLVNFAFLGNVKLNIDSLLLLHHYHVDEIERMKFFDKIRNCVYSSNRDSDVIAKPYQDPAQNRSFQDYIPKGCQRVAVGSLATNRFWTQYKVYKESLKKVCRADTVRQYQLEIFQQFKSFFSALIRDTFALRGQPPCDYDLRVFGAHGRQEMVFSSSFRLVLIIANEAEVPYFETLLSIFQNQISALGLTVETAENYLSFPSANVNAPEMRFSRGPGLNIPSVGTVKTYASLAEGSECFLEMLQLGSHSSSLHQQGANLFEQFQDALRKKNLKQAFYYDTIFPLSFENVLSGGHFEKFFHQFILNAALILGITKGNPLDIVDDLEKADVNGFSRITSQTGNLLRRAFSILYTVKLRQEQDLQKSLIAEGTQFLEKEIEELKSVYILTFAPLYRLFYTQLDSFQDEETPQFCVTSSEMTDKFKQLDLIQLSLNYWKRLNWKSLDQVSLNANLEEATEYVISLANHLIDSQAKDEEIENYYSQVSEIVIDNDLSIIPREEFGIDPSHLRENFVSRFELRKPKIVGKLLEVVAKDGTRLGEKRLRAKFQKSIESIVYPPEDPTVSDVKVVFPSKKVGYLKTTVRENLLDSDGHIKDQHPKSAHLVAFSEQKGLCHLHFKELPMQPLIEMTVHELCSRLFGGLTPVVELVRFEVTRNGASAPEIYPVLISQTIPGVNPEEQLKLSWNDCGQEHWTWMFLSLILFRPADGRLSNHIFDNSSGLMKAAGIDTEMAFVEPVVKEFLSKKVQFCSALFCLFPNERLDVNVLRCFATLDLDAILEGCFDHLKNIEDDYEELFKGEEERLFKRKMKPKDPNSKESRFLSKLCFREGTIATLNIQLLRLQFYIRSCIKQAQDKKEKLTITPLDLLLQLIYLNDAIQEVEVGPYVYEAYKNVKDGNINKCLRSILGREVTQSLAPDKYHRASLGSVPTLEEINKKKNVFLDDARKELFGKFLQTNDVMFNERKVHANFNSLDEYKQQKDLKILKAWMKESRKRKGSKLPRCIEIHDCTVLYGKDLKDLLHPELEILELCNCPKLVDDDIELIQATCKKLKVLNLRGCSGLRRLQLQGGVITTKEFSLLKRLDLRDCVNLRSLSIRAPFLSELSFEKTEALEGKDLVQINIATLKASSLPYQYGLVKRADLVYSIDESIHFETWWKSADKTLQEDPQVVIYLLNHLDWEDPVVNEREYLVGDPCDVIRGELLTRKDVMILACRRWPEFYLSLDEVLKNDQDVAQAAILKDPEMYRHIGEKLKQNKVIARAAIERNSSLFIHAGESLQNDSEIVSIAVKDNPYTLRYAGSDLRKDPAIVLLAVKQAGQALQYADPSLKSVREIVVPAVENDGLSLQHADESLQDDIGVVLKALRNNYMAYEFAGTKARRNRGIVLEALRLSPESSLPVSENIDEFSYYSNMHPSLRKDKKVAIAVVGKFGDSLKYFSAKLRNSFPIVIAALRKHPTSLEFASVSMKDNENVIELAIGNNPMALEFASARLKDNRELVQKAIRKNPLALKFASDRLKEDVELALEAMEINCESYSDLNDAIKMNRKFIIQALENCNACRSRFAATFGGNRYYRMHEGPVDYALNSQGKEFLHNDEELIVTAVSAGLSLGNLPDIYKENVNIVLSAVRRRGWEIQYANKRLFDVKEIVVTALKNSGTWSLLDQYRYIGNSLRNDPEVQALLKEKSNQEQMRKQLEKGSEKNRKFYAAETSFLMEPPLSLQDPGHNDLYGKIEDSKVSE